MEQSIARTKDEGGFLLFSISKVELNISKGQIVQGNFTLEEQSGLDVEGYVYSSNFRMHVDMPQLSGSEIQVDYTFDSTGMNPGDVSKGNFYVVTNRGEYVLPYVIMVQREVIDSSLGNIKNLFHFTNLAKSNWKEAVKVFYHPEFENIMSGNEAKYRNLYRGLSVQGNKNHNLEEFLIGINKKQKIEYIVKDEAIVLNNPSEDIVTTINIDRNGWGYTALAVSVKGDFIVPQKTLITGEDFNENTCYFKFSLDMSKLHAGKNPGKIVFKHLNGTLEVDVCVVNSSFARKSIFGRKQKSNMFAFVRYYLDYTSKKLSLQKWIMLSEELLSHGLSVSGSELADALMQAHLMMIGERFNEAKWILDKKVGSQIEDASNELYCYYQYLVALYSGDDYLRKETTAKIRNIYEKDKTNWRVGWILIKIADDLRRTPERKFGFCMELLRFGCTSPIVYIEALKALDENPSMLMHLDDTQMQVLMFGAKEGILSKDVMTQIAYLALRSKTYSKRLFKVLHNIYKKFNTDDVVQAICVQLMKGDMYGHKYFEYFSEAVERNLPLTRLYESYMLSMDLRKEIPVPKRVLMYFSYQSELPVAQNAYLYAYVYKNRESMDEIYRTYQENMYKFVEKQLRAGKIDKNLSMLYSNIVLDNLYCEENVKALSSLLLINCITVEDSDIRNVVVIDERLEQEMVFEVSRKKANVVVLGNDHTILLEDYAGNRFYNTREYSTERFFMPGKMVNKMDLYTEDNLLFNLYVCDENPEFLVITDRNVARYQNLALNENVSHEYRSKLALPLARFYMEKEDEIKADSILESVAYSDVSFRDYNEVLRYYTLRGMIDKALECAIFFGTDNLEPQVMLRLCTRWIAKEGLIEDDRILSLLVAAFERGKYDVEGLTYLVSFYKGPLKLMRNIWKAASDFYVDTYYICERMISQTLITGAFIGDEAAVLKQYVEGGAKVELEREYLSYFAHDYFVHGRVVDEYIFSEIERMYISENDSNTVCMLAYLKYYSANKDLKQLQPTTVKCIREFITDLYSGKGIVFPFFAAFKNMSVEAMQISNLTIIEYKGAPENKTTINYVYTGSRDEQGGFCREKMVDMYGGIFVKTFLLFFGESLQYYITEGEQLTESSVVTKSDAIGEGDMDRYSVINDIAIAATLKDYETALKLLEEYKYKEYLTDSIFLPQ